MAIRFLSNQTIDSTLDLTGRVKVSGSSTDQYFYEGSRTGVGVTLRLYDNSNNIYFDGYSGIILRANQIGGSGGSIVLSGGNVGVGIVPAASVALDVKEPDTSNDLILGLTAGTGARAQIRSVVQSADTESVLSFHTTLSSSTQERLRILATGALSLGNSGTNYGTAGQVLTSSGNSVPNWSTPTTGTITGSGTANKVTKFTGATAIGDGPITFSSNDSTFAGSVGVAGSNAPEKKLSINSAQSNGIQFNYDNTNNYRNQILNYWNSAPDTRMDFNIARTSGQTPETIMSVGYNSNVGIGTTSPSDKLQIVQGHSILVGDYFQLGSGSSDIMGALGWNRNTTNGVIYNTSFGAFQMHNNQGKLCLQGYNAGGTNQFQHEFYNSGNIFFDGNVGIGSSNVDSKFKVELNPSGTVLAGLRIGYNSSSANYFDGDTQYFRNGAGTTERMRITSGGNMLLGSAADFSRLTVSNGGSTRSTITISDQNTASLMLTAGANQASTISVDGTHALKFNFGANVGTDGGSTRMIILNNGNVGIGTTNPQGKLQVVNNSQSTSALTICNELNGGDGFLFQRWQYVESTTTFRLDLKQRVTSGIVQYAFDMVNNGTAYNSVLVLDRGNVGIGTTSPTAKLDIKRGLQSDTVSIANSAAYLSGQDVGIIIGQSNSAPYGTWIQSIRRSDGVSFPLSLNPSGSNVGIGKTNPAYTLDVTGSIYCTGSYIRASTAPDIWYSNNNIDTYTQTVLYMNQTNSSNNDANGYFFERGRISNSSTAEIRRWVVGARGGQKQMVLDGPGTLTVAGDLVAYGSPSDISLKENIKPIKNPLGKIKKLKGVTFDWKKSESILDIKKDYGFIAQDVQKVIPNLVRENEDGKLSLRDKGIVPILVEAIKELEARIKELENNL